MADTPTIEQVLAALEAADAAGNKEDATALAQIASQMINQTPAVEEQGMTPAEEDRGGYLKEKLLTPIANLAYGAKQAFGLLPGSPVARDEETYSAYMGITPQDILNKAGVQTFKPPASAAERAAYEGVSALTDPLTYAGGGLSIPAKAGIGFFAGAGSEVGGAVGEELGGTGGRIIGSLAGGVTASGLNRPSSYVAAGAGNLAKQVYNKWKDIKADPESAEKAFAAGRVKEFLTNAGDAAGDSQKLLNAAKAFKEIGNDLGIDAPLLVAIADNAVARDEILRLAKTDPLQRARIQAEVDRVTTAIDDKADQFFGKRYSPLPEGASLDPAVAARLEAIRKQSSQLEDKYNLLSDPFNKAPERMNIGVQAKKLLEANQKLVKAELQPQYDAVKKSAKRNGVVLDEKGVRDIYNFVMTNNLQDVFGRGTKVDTLILRNFRPQDGEFFPASFSALESLKRRVNEELRRTTEGTNEFRRLADLKTMVNTALESTGQYGARLKALDVEYYKRLGIPFNSASVNEIDAKRYATDVANTILKSKESLNQFLDAAGEGGVEIANNAMLAKAFNSSVVMGGTINPTQIERFLNQNKEVLSMMPSVRKKLEAAMFDGESLRSEIKNLDLQHQALQKRVSDNYFLQQGQADYNNIVSNFMSSNSYRQKLLRDVKDLSPKAQEAIMQNLRREFVNHVEKNAANGLDYITDPANRAALNDLMGAGYQDKVKKIFTLLDNVKKARITDVHIQPTSLVTDPIQRVTGVSTAAVTSQLRDRIASTVQKVVRLGSKWNDARASGAYDRQLMETLLDPNGVEKLSKMDTLSFRLNNPYTVQGFANSFLDSLPATVYGATRGFENEQVDKQKRRSDYGLR